MIEVGPHTRASKLAADVAAGNLARDDIPEPWNGAVRSILELHVWKLADEITQTHGKAARQGLMGLIPADLQPDVERLVRQRWDETKHLRRPPPTQDDFLSYYL